MDSKSAKSWLFGLGRGPAGTTGSLPLERMRKRRRAGHSAVYSLVAGQAKWKFRSQSCKAKSIHFMRFPGRYLKAG
jgi:hypothetical protein